MGQYKQDVPVHIMKSKKVPFHVECMLEVLHEIQLKSSLKPIGLVVITVAPTHEN